MNSRYLAVKALTPLLNHNGSLKYSLKQQLQACPDEQRPLLQQLCYGSMRYYNQLELIVDELVSKPMKRKDQDIKALLIIGIYQLYKLNIADHAVINQTVDVCEQLKKSWATSLVNATLRTFQRQQEQILTKLNANNSFKFNHPDWFIEKLKHNWPTRWEQILQANDEHPPLTLRVNLNKVSRETLISQLKELDIESIKTEHSKYGVTLSKPTDVTKLPGWDEGHISVQDEAAQLAADLVNPLPNENILDACSAPGGKLLHLLELTDCELTRIQGLELEEHRVERIKENFFRLDLDCHIHIADAASKSWWDEKPFNTILLDAPCSATGVIRRNPDIKLLRRAEDIHSTAKLQRVILQNMWEMLADKGKLVYATCSIFAQENERMIASFLKANADATHVEIEANWGEKREYGRQLFPQNGANDGFYYAVLEKS